VKRHPELGLTASENLCDIVRVTDQGSGASPRTKAKVLQALLVDAGDQHIHLALLTALVPGCHTVRRQLAATFYQSSDPEQLNDIITSASEVIRDWAGQDRPYAGQDILNATHHRVRRTILHDRSIQQSSRRLDDQYHDLISAEPVEIDEYREKIAAFVAGENGQAARMALRRIDLDEPWTDIASDEGLVTSTARRQVRNFLITNDLVPAN
jgi:hypothetical protein